MLADAQLTIELKLARATVSFKNSRFEFFMPQRVTGSRLRFNIQKVQIGNHLLSDSGDTPDLPPAPLIVNRNEVSRIYLNQAGEFMVLQECHRLSGLESSDNCRRPEGTF